MIRCLPLILLVAGCGSEPEFRHKPIPPESSLKYCGEELYSVPEGDCLPDSSLHGEVYLVEGDTFDMPKITISDGTMAEPAQENTQSTSEN